MTTFSDQIRSKYELGEVQHMTDLQNLELILRELAILSNNQIKKKSIQILDISNQSVQCGRANITIPCTSRPLHDYVPLYWGKKTPMVSALRSQNETLVFLMFSTDLLAEFDCVLSDGNARSNGTTFKVFKQLSDLDFLNHRDINTLKFAHDDEIKRRKQSELLVLDRLPLKHLRYIICYSEIVKLKVQALLIAHGARRGVYIGRSNYYF